MKKSFEIPWIINKTQDSVWIVGSVFFSYLFLILYYGMNSILGLSIMTSSLVIYFLWTLIFDGTHVFATYTRTYFDNNYRKKNHILLYSSIVLFLVGPAYMMFYYIFGTETQVRAAFLVFNRFCIIYAYYHLIRQHWGFIAIYNRKAGISGKSYSFFDNALLWSGVSFAFFYHNSHHYVPFGLAEKLASDISSADWSFIASSLGGVAIILFVLTFFVNNFIQKGNVLQIYNKAFYYVSLILLSSSISVMVISHYGLQSTLLFVTILLKATFIFALVGYVFFVLNNVDMFLKNIPKLVLLVAVVFTHIFIFSLPLSYVVAYACVTVFHNIQYHAIIRYHNIRKYSNDQSNKYGWATNLTKSLALFIILALSFNFISTIPRATLNFVNIPEIYYYVAGAFFWGFGIHHYVLDSIIWRPSKDPEVRKSLGVS